MDAAGSSTSGTRSSLGTKVSLPAGDQGNGLKIGIVREAETSDAKRFTLINFETGEDQSIILLMKNNAGFLVGRLVVYDKRDQRVFCLENELYSFLVHAPIKPNSGKKKIECPECGAVIRADKLSDHLKVAHWIPRRPFGRTKPT